MYFTLKTIFDLSNHLLFPSRMAKRKIGYRIFLKENDNFVTHFFTSTKRFYYTTKFFQYNIFFYSFSYFFRSIQMLVRKNIILYFLVFHDERKIIKKILCQQVDSNRRYFKSLLATNISYFIFTKAGLTEKKNRK